MVAGKTITIDGNEAAATVAYLCSEVIAIYPITPASPMGEHADAWSARGRRNVFGNVPKVIEMQSEAGAAGTVHGALQAGVLTTTFTASQGLLLMLPNMYKIAGELTPAVFHVAARSIASHALSIFCDHSDVMAARGTGFAMLCSCSVQEVMDLALIAHIATLESRIPILHFFDGFRTSHEISRIEAVTVDMVDSLLDRSLVRAHRQRALSPEHPVIRGTAQNPDIFFTSRERINSRYEAMPGIVQEVMDRFAGMTGRHYRLFEYSGAPDPDRVVIMMGSGAETAQETVEALNRTGERVGLVKVRLYRPFCGAALLASLPASVRQIAVLDRVKEPGADGEPLYKDVVTCLSQACMSGQWQEMPQIRGGRYGLSSREFTPAMLRGVFNAMKEDSLPNGFTAGIRDDLGGTSIEPDAEEGHQRCRGSRAAVFYGLGSDGTVSANKHSIKIIGESTPLHVQGYFEYDSKKSGAVTVSHLRFGPQPIRSAYLIQEGEAGLVACHHSSLLDRYHLLSKAAHGAVFLLNTGVEPRKVWASLPSGIQHDVVEKSLRLYVIDASRVARQVGMGKRINTIMQTCFFALSDILPGDEAIRAIKEAVRKTWGNRGRRIVEFNFRAIDETLRHLHPVEVEPAGDVKSCVRESARKSGPLPANRFIREVTLPMIAGQGDSLPVSLMPEDGTFPTGTAVWEKRNLSDEVPVLETDLCTQCGKCVFVCPHSAIRSKVFPSRYLDDAPASFRHMPVIGKDFGADMHITYQVSAEDCTGCRLCVDICPIRDKSQASRKALNMAPREGAGEADRNNWEFFLGLPVMDRTGLKSSTIRGAMVMEPLFEFSGACSGCGETPYLRLASQLFGDRMLVANATGCSSIYGGNLPTTPWAANQEGRGPAWSNSLFEDNAEFGLGMRISLDYQQEYALELLRGLAADIGDELVRELVSADQSTEKGIEAQRQRVALLKKRLAGLECPQALELEGLADMLVRRSVWIVGGDGWAYDIGFGGLDHVLASGKDVNILVLDTEVYSNTGGQMSKATPLGAVAKFSAEGKARSKKNLALFAMDYENVYVAQVAYGARDTQTLHAFLEAESWPGTSIIIAYSPCIAHGIDLEHNHRQQDLAVRSGHWNLLRYDPRRLARGQNPLRLDSRAPSIPYEEFAGRENRFSLLANTHPDNARALMQAAQQEVRERYHHYEQLAGLSVDDSSFGKAPAAGGDS